MQEVRKADEAARGPSRVVSIRPPRPVEISIPPLSDERRSEAGAEFLSRASIERSLSREMLLSERFRAQLLAVIFGGALIVFLSASAAYPDEMAAFFLSRLDRVRVGLLLGGFAAYELIALRG